MQTTKATLKKKKGSEGKEWLFLVLKEFSDL